jgi:hypothetical protein
LEVQGALRESLTRSEELCSDLEEVRTQASSEDLAKQSRIEKLETVRNINNQHASMYHLHD